MVSKPKPAGIVAAQRSPLFYWCRTVLNIGHPPQPIFFQVMACFLYM